MHLMNPSEPTITINGIELSEGQALTVRVAIENFAEMLCSEYMADLGEALRKGYMARIEEIRGAIFNQPRAQSGSSG